MPTVGLLALVPSHETNIMLGQNTNHRPATEVRVMNSPLKIGAVCGVMNFGMPEADGWMTCV